jgi:hypothetical protein
VTLLQGSRAQLFFDEVKDKAASAFTFLSELAHPSSETDENEWRECKGAKTFQVSVSECAGKVREIWSESLSAFGNSGGGVLIFGIDAPDRLAVGVSLAPDARALAERLLDWTADATDPPVLGVDAVAVTESAAETKGFVVCLIPPSPLLPHRAKWAKREYYIRTQDGSHPCTTGTLRSLFYPRTSCLLVPVVGASLSCVGEDYHLGFRVRVVNRGLASAREAYIVAGSTFGSKFYYADHFWRRIGINEAGVVCLETIHPGQEISFVPNLQSPDIAVSAWRDDADFVLTFSVCARDMERLCWRVSFKGSELCPRHRKDCQLTPRDATRIECPE